MMFSKIVPSPGITDIDHLRVLLTSWVWAQVAADTGSKGNAPAPGQQPAGPQQAFQVAERSESPSQAPAPQLGACSGQ